MTSGEKRRTASAMTHMRCTRLRPSKARRKIRSGIHVTSRSHPRRGSYQSVVMRSVADLRYPATCRLPPCSSPRFSSSTNTLCPSSPSFTSIAYSPIQAFGCRYRMRIRRERDTARPRARAPIKATIACCARRDRSRAHRRSARLHPAGTSVPGSSATPECRASCRQDPP